MLFYLDDCKTAEYRTHRDAVLVPVHFCLCKFIIHSLFLACKEYALFLWREMARYYIPQIDRFLAETVLRQ